MSQTKIDLKTLVGKTLKSYRTSGNDLVLKFEGMDPIQYRCVTIYSPEYPHGDGSNRHHITFESTSTPEKPRAIYRDTDSVMYLPSYHPVKNLIFEAPFIASSSTGPYEDGGLNLALEKFVIGEGFTYEYDYNSWIVSCNYEGVGSTLTTRLALKFVFYGLEISMIYISRGDVLLNRVWIVDQIDTYRKTKTTKYVSPDH